MREVALIVIFIGAFAGACGNFPKDPHHSFDKALKAGLRVGVINDPPWAVWEGGTAAGIEADMITAFADRHRMQVEWVPGAEHDLMLALEESELHIVIGGITKDSPFKELVGFTNPHSEEEIVICGLGGTSDVRRREVGVAAGSGIGVYVKKQGGIPVYVDSLAEYSGPVAVARRGAEAGRFMNCSEPIKTLHHVIAVAKGENELLVKLEEHIDENERR